MVFSTLTFLFFFLPLVLVSYFICKNRVYRNMILLLFSLLFYAWGEPKYIFLMLAVSLVAYVGGLLMDSCDRKENQKARKAVFITVVILLISNLFVFKYLNFFVDNVNYLFSANLLVQKIALPIGISFYTFQILSYVIDLYRREIAVQKNYLYLTLYVTFFPQLIAGPIVRYSTIEQEIGDRYENLEDVAAGLRRFCVGLAKKVLLANPIGLIASTIYGGDPQKYGTALYWLAAIAFALQIYYDFSGYSDMAIGMGRMFGFHFLENFRYPYVADSVTDFWRRWHISLSTWFRDYIYIPLGGNRCSRGRWMFNLCVVWGLTGMWHGAQWNFILWGVYYAALLLAEKLLLNRWLEKMPGILRRLYTLLFVIIGWVIFNSNSMGQIGQTLSMMFGMHPCNLADILVTDQSVLFSVLYLPIGIVCMLPWKEWIPIRDTALTAAVQNVLCLILFVLSFMFILSSSYNPFIYFRF